MQTRIVLLFVFAAAAIAAAALPAPAARTQRSPCQAMKAKHRDLSPHPRLVVAERGFDDKGNIAACLLPGGKVRKLVAWDDGLARDRYRVEAARGFFVLVANSYGDQYGGIAGSLARYDGRNATGVTLTSFACLRETPQSTCPEGFTFDKVALAANGAGALERIDMGTDTTTLESFDPAGALARLDDGPVDALRVAGSEIVWSRDGTERRAPLPG